MFDQGSPSYSQNFPPLENFDHPQTNTKHVWKIKNPVGATIRIRKGTLHRGMTKIEGVRRLWKLVN